MDKQADIISETIVKPEGGPPYEFALQYDSSSIRPQNRYALRARIEMKEQLLFTNTTHIPALGGDDGVPVEILVQRIGGQGSHKVAGEALASLENTRWKVLQLKGALPQSTANGEELHLTLSNQSVRGFSGCNSFNGSFETKGTELRFATLAVTNMACVDGEQVERSFLAAMGEIRHYRILGETIKFIDSSGRTVLLCEALYL